MHVAKSATNLHHLIRFIIQCPYIYKRWGRWRGTTMKDWQQHDLTFQRKHAYHKSVRTDDILESVFLDQISELVQVAHKPT